MKSDVIFEIWNKNYPLKKTFKSLRHFWNFRNFRNFDNFWNFKCKFWPNGHNYCQFFFVIFDENDILYILVKFETDRMSPCESAKNGRIGAHGPNCIFFVDSELIFVIYDENYPKKKNFMSLRLFWNFRHQTWPIPTYTPNLFSSFLFTKNTYKMIIYLLIIMIRPWLLRNINKRIFY